MTHGKLTLAALVLSALAIAAAVGAGVRSHGSAEQRESSGATPVHRASEPPTKPPIPGESDLEPLYSPEDALKLFKIDPAFAISLAAAEPMVEAPVCLSFDEDGRAWVVEMRGYMRDTRGTTESEPTGRIKILEDTDGDGVFDKDTIFLDKLVMPRAVMPCFGGALVLEPPSLYFCRDTNGDGVCDEKRKLADGLAGENPEHAPNGLMYGMDNWVKLSQSPLEFRFDGEKIVSRKTPAHGQWGITQDERGRLYYAPNPEALRGDLYPKHYAARNPAQRDRPGINELICRDQTVWPSRPTPGVNRGYMEGILRADGTLAAHTAACSPLIYLASLMRDCRGDEFVCEPAAYMVRRLRVTETLDGPRAANVYERSEFLTSTDERFRPVALTTGPDGAIYITDMHRGVIQHKTYLTPYLKEQIEKRKLEGPLDTGRIFRVAKAGARQSARPAEKLSAATDARLVELLDDPDAYRRCTAQRLLVERRSRQSEGLVRLVTMSSDSPVCRLHAFWTLEGLGVLTVEDALRATWDPDQRVRLAGVRLCEAFMNGPQAPSVLARLREMASGDAAMVLQVGLSAGECRQAEIGSLLAQLAREHGTDAMVRSAIVSGVGGREGVFLRMISGDDWLNDRAVRAVAAAVAESACRRGPGDQRAELCELIGVLAPRADGKAELLLERLRAEQRVESSTPRVLKLAREPAGWSELTAGGTRLARDAAESTFYLDWPGKPHVDPPKRARALTPDEHARFERGKGLFSVCAACHGPDGQGVPGQTPPLAGSARAQGPRERAIRVLLQGLDGPLTGSAASGINGSMPAALFQHDDEIAAVLTYVRQAWGNNGEPVSREDVAKIRGETRGRTRPWKVEELDAIH